MQKKLVRRRRKLTTEQALIIGELIKLIQLRHRAGLTRSQIATIGKVVGKMEPLLMSECWMPSDVEAFRKCCERLLN